MRRFCLKGELALADPRQAGPDALLAKLANGLREKGAADLSVEPGELRFAGPKGIIVSPWNWNPILMFGRGTIRAVPQPGGLRIQYELDVTFYAGMCLLLGALGGLIAACTSPFGIRFGVFVFLACCCGFGLAIQHAVVHFRSFMRDAWGNP